LQSQIFLRSQISLAALFVIPGGSPREGHIFLYRETILVFGAFKTIVPHFKENFLGSHPTASGD